MPSERVIGSRACPVSRAAAGHDRNRSSNMRSARESRTESTMAVHEDGFYLAERVRRLCSDRPHGLEPWKGQQICELLERAWRVSTVPGRRPSQTCYPGLFVQLDAISLHKHIHAILRPSDPPPWWRFAAGAEWPRARNAACGPAVPRLGRSAAGSAGSMGRLSLCNWKARGTGGSRAASTDAATLRSKEAAAPAA
jgi:hypothetical protein